MTSRWTQDSSRTAKKAPRRAKMTTRWTVSRNLQDVRRVFSLTCIYLYIQKSSFCFCLGVGGFGLHRAQRHHFRNLLKAFWKAFICLVKAFQRPLKGIYNVLRRPFKSLQPLKSFSKPSKGFVRAV